MLRNLFRRLSPKLLILILMQTAMVASIAVAANELFFFKDRQDISLPFIILASAAIMGAVGLALVFASLQKGEDLINRRVFEKLDAVQRNIESNIRSDYFLSRSGDLKVFKGIGRGFNISPPNESSSDDSETPAAAKPVDPRKEMLAFLNARMIQLGSRLEAPASRAERRAFMAMCTGYLLALAGIVMAGYRVYALQTDNYEAITYLLISKNMSVWPILIAKAAPWIGAIALIELVAIFLLKLSFNLMQFSRQLSALYSQFEERYCGLTLVLQSGSKKEQIIAGYKMLETGHLTDQLIPETLTAESVAAFTEKATALISALQSFQSPKTP